MATRRKPSAAELKKQVLELKAQVYNLSEKYEETVIFERLTERQKDDLNVMLHGYQRMYGPVQYHHWLRAVVRSMRGYFTDVGKILVFPALERKYSDAQKKQFLEAIAKQMDVDVTVTLNKQKK